MVETRLLDTDILSHFFRNDVSVVNHARAYLQQHSALSISIITYYEVLRGLRYINARRQLRDLERFVRLNHIVALDARAVDFAADVYVQLRQQGQLINEADILIAGIALANDAVLVTNNTAHFSRIPQLQLDNWLSP